VIGTYDDLSHCQGFSSGRTDHICGAGVDEYFIPVVESKCFRHLAEM